MSILGAVLRSRPAQIERVLARLDALPGIDVALNPGDGRLVLVLEDTQDEAGVIHRAAAHLADMALWPEVLSTSLVYEYSGPDAPAHGERDMSDFRLWRSRPGTPSPAGAEGASLSAGLTATDTPFSSLPLASLSHPVPSGAETEQTP